MQNYRAQRAYKHKHTSIQLHDLVDRSEVYRWLVVLRSLFCRILQVAYLENRPKLCIILGVVHIEPS